MKRTSKDTTENPRKRRTIENGLFLRPECTECPICTEALSLPVYTCSEGHVLCNDCREKIKKCPVCKKGPIEFRCRAVENVFEHIDNVPCKYQDVGCPMKLKFAAVRAHEELCEFRPIKCFEGNRCQFEGAGNDLAAHLNEEHKYRLCSSQEMAFTCSKVQADYPWKHWVTTIHSCFGDYFMMEFLRMPETSSNHLYFRVVILGPSKPEYRYNISLADESNSFSIERRQCRVTSHHEPFEVPQHSGTIIALPRCLTASSDFKIVAKAQIFKVDANDGGADGADEVKDVNDADAPSSVTPS